MSQNSERAYIAVGGAKGSGKDTFGRFFTSRGFVKINFADHLKWMLSSAFSINKTAFYFSALKEAPFGEPLKIEARHISALNDIIAETHVFQLGFEHVGRRLASPRELMQFVGVDMIRSAHQNYLREATLPKMLLYDKVVCCDIRFPDELDCMKQLAASTVPQSCFVSVYVKRAGCNGDAHLSENSFTPEMADHVVANDGTVEELYDIAKTMILAPSLTLSRRAEFQR